MSSEHNSRPENIVREEITIQLDPKIENHQQQPKEKDTLLTVNDASARADVDDFDETVSRPVYDSPTVRVKSNNEPILFQFTKRFTISFL